MRILHVGLFHKLGSGQRAQLEYERAAAQSLEGAIWETHTLTPEPVRTDDGPRVPAWARRFQLAKLYTWLHIRRQAAQYDAILMRSISPDPFAALMAPLIPNLFTVHHSKEIEEISLVTKGPRLALTLFLEGGFKRWAFRRLRGVIGVTDEIAQYEAERFPRARVVATYPNGIDIESVGIAAEPSDQPAPLRAVFVCSVFYAWHGLDRLLAALEALPADGTIPVRVDLVGRIEDDQRAQVEALAARGIVVVHGDLSDAEMLDVFREARVAIASLALDRNGLRQASTLKVRQYLAAGLPVYSTHIDAGLPRDFPYYHCDDSGFSIERMVAFHDALGDRRRASVREAARPYVDKHSIMESLVAQLGEANLSDSARKTTQGDHRQRR
ncbi:glycosyltransferase [Microbacterium sp. Au-Mic1]|uniref:glycosyltransferase n=1 Tax=Microbacterium sp. Au-Mic1 TaxID=2906457 RepID=UPI001E300341|nr:glycosyltransferase [Microbacterium sp. Au-Mic1]MCE4027327.1 glycosyltransferase [Microbacterium sp. Au-Mic1]